MLLTQMHHGKARTPNTSTRGHQCTLTVTNTHARILNSTNKHIIHIIITTLPGIIRTSKVIATTELTEMCHSSRNSSNTNTNTGLPNKRLDKFLRGMFRIHCRGKCLVVHVQAI